MGRSKAKKPRTSNSTASSIDSSPSSTPQNKPDKNEVSDILISINNRLAALDARISLIEVLHKEFQQLRHSLEYSQNQIESLTKENTSLRSAISTINTQLPAVSAQLTTISAENNALKETILDLQTRSMRDNLIFSGITESSTTEDPEKLVKDFMLKQLKLPPDTVNNITFHRVHRLGRNLHNTTRPRPIIAKFEHYKQKELVQKQGRQLKGTHFGLNDQFPQEINRRRKQLLPIRKQMMSQNKKAVLIVDKLYVEGQLFKDKDVTPWLY